jgi:surfeit locus 1 family protein
MAAEAEATGCSSLIFPLSNILHLMFSRRWLLTTLLVFSGIAVTIRLGIWQIDRDFQKRSQNNHISASQALPVLELSTQEVQEDLQEMEYRVIRITGTYDYEHQVAIRNQFWTQQWGIESGYALLTPLILNNGRAMMVERGWIPAKYDTPASWRQFDEPGPVTVQGVIRLEMPKGEMGGGVPDPTLSPGQQGLDLWNFVNINRLQDQMPYPLYPVYIQQAPDADKISLPYPIAAEPDLSGSTHLGFALQWFFFASLFLFGYPVYLKIQAERGVL